MSSLNQNQEKVVFESMKNQNRQGMESWSARRLAQALGYSEYRHFLPVVKKAKEACLNSQQSVKNHFEDVLDMVEIGSGASRRIDDITLSRYACYLIVQNADPAKPIVALGQTYFAVQTRKQELIESSTFAGLKNENEKRIFLRDQLKYHNRKLAGTARMAGVVTSLDYAIFQDHGYKGLYGGLTNRDIHRRKRLNKNQHILDHMGSTELAANLFRATQADEKIKREAVREKGKANLAHFEVGKKVRQTIKELGGDVPENLPSMPSIKNVQKKLGR